MATGKLPKIDRFVKKDVYPPTKPLEDQGVPVENRPVLQPFCTCFIASGGPGHRDENNQPICQVHFPKDQALYDSSTFGGKDNIPRN